MSTRPTLQEARRKAEHYCAWQERCHSEVEGKLMDLGLNAEERGELISHLIKEGFLNEERFARAFARGKFRQLHWGRIKIVQGLKQKGLNQLLINLALSEISDEDYHDTLKSLAEKKARSLKGAPLQRKASLLRYLQGRGFEQEYAFKAAEQVLKGGNAEW
ncbi:MAG: recombination regulator RecX [Bacteroidetes bacterium]|nr:recombination regulator RecX [Bacteroidota bacterium]